ncbi:MULTISPECIES: (2Fe-2S)-binding protein [Oceanospirillaceae]|uniref:Bacterioferritin-associated ferredoxin n=1 Tax=Oceanobacter antarcticus TaxID=3133425 RepID=A0ABW8NLN7_9GAMM
MYVCLCKAVTNQQVKDAVEQGQSYGEMRRSLGLATDCGCCGRVAKQLIQEHVRTLPECEFANVG